MKQSKCCSNCERGIPLYLTKDILCKYRGVVTADYVCFKYKNSTDKSSNQQVLYRCTHCEYFLVQLDSPNQNVGKCKLFSVREYDGSTRNACSKFSKRILADEVS